MKKETGKINILFCGNDKVEDGLFICILSLIKNIKEPLHIYVLTMSFSQDEHVYHPLSVLLINYLNELVKKHHSDSFVMRIDVTDLFCNSLPSANLNTRFTPYCMLRLFADQIKELPDKILYLDTDILCRRDCGEFYHQNIDGYEIAGVLDYYGCWFFRQRIWRLDYLNSGVLLMNLPLIRQSGLLKKCRQLCATKKMFMPDQSALNKYASAKKILPRRFNEQRKLKNDTVLQHFSTTFRFFPWLHTLTVKPWQLEEVHLRLKLHEYDDIFNEYKRLQSDIKPDLMK